MQLALAEVGRKCIIKSFACSCDVRMRMMTMGFFPGCPVEIMGRMNGTLLVRIGQSRLMLNCCLANQIHVS